MTSAANPLQAAQAKLAKLGITTASPVVQPQPRLSTGSQTLDGLTGGMPVGGMVQVYGHRECGETTFALAAAAAATGPVAYVDSGRSFDCDYAAHLGVPVDDPARFALLQPATLEDALTAVDALIAAGVALIVIDTLGGLRPARVVAGEASEAEVRGLPQRIWAPWVQSAAHRLRGGSTVLLGLGSCGRAWARAPLRLRLHRHGVGPDGSERRTATVERHVCDAGRVGDEAEIRSRPDGGWAEEEEVLSPT